MIHGSSSTNFPFDTSCLTRQTSPTDHQTSLYMNSSTENQALFFFSTVPSGSNFISAGLTWTDTTGPSSCSKSSCSGRMAWSDGTSFVWQSWMDAVFSEFQRQYGTNCFVARRNGSAVLGDQSCHHSQWHLNICQKSCLVTG